MDLKSQMRNLNLLGPVCGKRSKTSHRRGQKQMSPNEQHQLTPLVMLTSIPLVQNCDGNNRGRAVLKLSSCTECSDVSSSVRWLGWM
jgi:hypothetical protein